MTVRELKEWLIEEIQSARSEAEESHKSARNSYGAGYDRGFLNALERVRLKIIGELDT